jgi:hypothetical protein
LVEAWDALPKLDSYAWRWVSYHLVQTGRKDAPAPTLAEFRHAKLRSTIQVRPVILNARCRLLTIRSSHPWSCSRARASLRLWWPASAMTVRILGNNALNPPSSRAPARRSDVSDGSTRLATCPQKVKDGVEDATKVGVRGRPPCRAAGRTGATQAQAASGQVGVVEASTHRTAPVARVSAYSR